MAILRREALLGLTAGWLAPSALRAAEAANDIPFDDGYVASLAAHLAREPYVAPERQQGAPVSLDYDAWRRIARRHEKELWAGSDLPFRLVPYPTGYLYADTVRLFEVTGGRASPIVFSSDDYSRPPELDDAVAAMTGFSGFRLHGPVGGPGDLGEFAVFQGASYFRSLGRGESYGLSARGACVRTGEANEEFPAFRAFWIERPGPFSAGVVVHALLDSPSLTGAYRFVVTPGMTTVFDVQATLFPRRDLVDGGVAPQSSMYLFGAADHAGIDDFRDAVHDSDGLAFWTEDGQAVWRPLVNPTTLQMSVYETGSPKGFGLVQRLRDVEAFGDLEARYDLRPSLWVEPVGDWGPGSVHLLEIPAVREAVDNMAAFWRPAAPWPALQPVSLRYRLHWGFEPPYPAERALVTRTRVGGTVPPGARQFAIDFAPATVDGVFAEGSTDAGRLGQVYLAPHPDGRTVRATFRFEPPANGPAELSMRLVSEAGDLSETWRFRWTA